MSHPIPLRANHILVPLDMKDTRASDHAVAVAVWLSGAAGAKLSILSVASPLGRTLSDTADRQEPAFNSHVSDLATRHNAQINPIFRSHESFETALRETVKEAGVDLIVLSTHHPWFSDRLFSSHAAQTTLHNDCSVLVVRD